MNQRQQQMTQGPSTAATNTPGGEDILYSHEQMVSIAKKNRKAQQQKRRNNQRREATVKKQQPGKQHENQHLSPRRNRKHTMPQKDTHQKNAGKQKGKQNPNGTFLAKSRAAALQQSKIHMERQQSRSFIKIDEKELLKSPTVDVITLSDSTQNSPIKVFMSDNKYDFKVTSPNSPEIPPKFVSTISTPKIDKAVEKIHKLKTTPTLSSPPILNIAIPDGNTTQENQEQCGSKDTEKANEMASTSNVKIQNENDQTKPEEPKEAENDRIEEHYAASTSRGRARFLTSSPRIFMRKNYISEILRGGWGSVVPGYLSPHGDNKMTTKIPKSSIYKH